MHITSIADIISLSLIPALGSPVILATVTDNKKYLLIFIGAFAVSITTACIKILFGAYTRNKLFYRPIGCTNCTLLNGRSRPDEPAFPSGHMSSCTFLVMTMLYVSGYYKNKLYVVAGIVYILMMAYSRFAKRCHNIPQIIGGIIYGAICAHAFNMFI